LGGGGGGGGLGVGGGGGGAGESMDIPKQMVGRVIGRGGETVRGLQAQSGANVSIDQNVPEGAPCKVTISGAPDQVARAKAMITELLSDGGKGGGPQFGAGGSGGGAEKVLPIQQQHVGKIIGKGGETIKGMQNQTGARIQIDQNAWTCTITGTPQAVEQAAQIIATITAGGDPPDYRQGPGGGGGYGPPGGGYGGGGGYAPPAAGGYGGYGPSPGYGGYPPPGYGGYAPPPGYGGYPPYGGGGGYGGYPPAQGGQPGGSYPPAGQSAPQQGGYSQQPAYQQGGYQQGGYQQASAAPASQPAAAPAAAAPAASSSPWQLCYDPQNRPYYYNSQTQVSQWEKPADMP